MYPIATNRLKKNSQAEIFYLLGANVNLNQNKGPRTLETKLIWFYRSKHR
jgi:hypothetical protein